MEIFKCSEKELRMHTFYMDIAKRASELSYANRSKVGAVLVKDNNILSFSWNGNPTGFDNKCEDINGNTLPTVVHAESNIFSKMSISNSSSKGSTLYCTLSPCFDCSKLIIQSGVKKVIYLEEYRIKDSIDFLKKAGIEVVRFECL